MKDVIRRTILEMDKPFLISELFRKLEEKNITNHSLILMVLCDLMNSGLVECADVEHDNGIYCSAFASATTYQE